MNSSINILFTSAGRRVSLVKRFKTTLYDLGLEGNIIVADHSEHAPTRFIADIYEPVPWELDELYIKELISICIKHQVKLLIPLIDKELLLISKYKKEFEEIGVIALVSSPEVNEICCDKRKTTQFFRTNGIDSPKVYDPNVMLTDHDIFPVILKPAFGSSSIGVTTIRNQEELKFFINHISEPIVQELIIGEEYTVDVLVDFDGRVRTIVPRMRIETRAGEVSKGMTVKNYQIIEAVKKVVEHLPGVIGCITIQCFLTPDHQIKFIEINPRFGGGIPLSIAAGADFPKWLILMLLKQSFEIKIDDWQDGVVMLRYDSEIIVTREAFGK